MDHNNPYQSPFSHPNLDELSSTNKIFDDGGFLKARTRQTEATTDSVITARYLQFLAEMRMAIGFMTADGNNQPHAAEQMHPMKSAFDEINAGRLQQRYLYVTDLLIKQMDPQFNPEKL